MFGRIFGLRHIHPYSLYSFPPHGIGPRLQLCPTTVQREVKQCFFMLRESEFTVIITSCSSDSSATCWTIFRNTIVNRSHSFSGPKKKVNSLVRTSFDEIVCAIDGLKLVRGAGDAFQPATITVQMDGLTGAICATGFFALSG